VIGGEVEVAVEELVFVIEVENGVAEKLGDEDSDEVIEEDDVAAEEEEETVDEEVTVLLVEEMVTPERLSNVPLTPFAEGFVAFSQATGTMVLMRVRGTCGKVTSLSFETSTGVLQLEPKLEPMV
jgi:hypothetical protein